VSCCSETAAVLTSRHRVRVRYSGGRPVIVKGPVTGASYRFSGVAPLQFVDPRDAVAITRDGPFRFEGVVEMASPEVVWRAKGSGDNA
jgi:hypothetical protein